MDLSPSPWYILQFHQEAHSPYLYMMAQDKRLWFKSKTLLYIDLGTQVDTININKSNYTCKEDNSNRFMHCMENYYSEKLGCMLPWVLKNNIKNSSMNLCNGKEKYKEFKEVVMKILKPEETKELTNKCCFVPNCMQRSWKIRREKTMELMNNENIKTGFQFEMPPNAKVLVRKEVKLYTLINFFAEVGGYLGLLLGESLLSYFIKGSKWFKILGRKLIDRCRKTDKEQEPTPA